MFANNVCSGSFPIRGGVRQGCVLSPRFFCSVLEMAKTCWRVAVEDLGLDLRYGGPALLDFKFACDILIFGTSYNVIGIGTLLEKIVENLEAVGLQLMWTKNFTSQAQPLRLQTPNGLTISSIDLESIRMAWITTPLEKSTTRDVDHRLQTATNMFNVNKWILSDPRVAMATKYEIRIF